ncbi:MAG: S-methyl-5'-thioadenosine phosphorylase [Planctomycetes bacterium]|nr:S-methyl-5'-thioadenosine phosphorylase [Planctomycetota bacterium]
MNKPKVGIIGGSGLGDRLAARKDVEQVFVDTPFGPPSGPLLSMTWHDVDVFFLSRHGEGHTLPPSAVPYQANIFALKSVGVNRIIASGAVGSLREEIQPEHLVVCDQVIDKTHQRNSSFFEQGLAAHIEWAEPFCPTLRSALIEATNSHKTTVHKKGTYVAMEGPQFSTRAESHMHRAWGGDLIGMTCCPEAKLAREAEMCYALVAMATDYDCWRESPATLDKHALLQEIIGHLDRAATSAFELIEQTVIQLGKANPTECNCQSALELAIWSDKSKVDPAMIKKLRPIIGRYFE